MKRRRTQPGERVSPFDLVLKARGLVKSQPFVGAGGGWVLAHVMDLDTGEERGHRWLKARATGGVDVRKEAP